MTNTQHLQQERQKRLLFSIYFWWLAAPTLKYLFQFNSLPLHQLPAIFTVKLWNYSYKKSSGDGFAW
ncbi:hypothetical protein AB3S75_016613 [Citrus x aurantiifolia]